jgi:hypothetical protein
VGNQAERSSILINSQHPLMPLFITVTPGTTVTNSTVLDPTALNLLGNPAIDINGTVDGGSLSLAAGSVTTTALADDAVTFAKFQNIGTDRLLGRDTNGPGNVEELTVGGGLGFTGAGGIEIANNQVTYSKIEQVSGSRLLGNPTGSSANVSEITLGAGLAFQSGALVNTGAGKYRADFQFSRGDAPSTLSIPASSVTDNVYWPFIEEAIFTEFQTQFIPTNYQLTVTLTNDQTQPIPTPLGLTLQYSSNLTTWTDVANWDVRGAAGYRNTTGSITVSGVPTVVYYRLKRYNPSHDNSVSFAALGLTLSLWN